MGLQGRLDEGKRNQMLAPQGERHLSRCEDAPGLLPDAAKDRPNAPFREQQIACVGIAEIFEIGIKKRAVGFDGIGGLPDIGGPEARTGPVGDRTVEGAAEEKDIRVIEAVPRPEKTDGRGAPHQRVSS